VRPGKGGGRGGVRVNAGVYTDTRHAATRRNPHPNSSSHARHACQRTTQTACQGQGRPRQGGVRCGRRVGLHTVGRVLAGTRATHHTTAWRNPHTNSSSHGCNMCQLNTQTPSRAGADCTREWRPGKGGGRGGVRVSTGSTPTHATPPPGATHTQIAAHTHDIHAKGPHKQPSRVKGDRGRAECGVGGG
jgi:hypothetical protein